MEKLTFIKSEHKYKINGKYLPSVTQVIGDVLKGEREVEQTEAMYKGQVIHKTLELLDNDELGEYDQRLQGYIDSWIKFKQETKAVIISNEFKTYSEFGFAGTIDRVLTIGNDRYVIDIKTGKSYKEYPLQTMAYKIMLNDESIKRACVYINETGYEIEEHTNEQDKDIFLSLLMVWRWKKNRL